MKKVLLSVLMLFPVTCLAQNGYIHGNGDPRTITPTPNCGSSRFYIDDSTGNLYMASQGSPCVWAPANSGGGGGGTPGGTNGQVQYNNNGSFGGLTGAGIATAIGATAVQNATNAVNATNATNAVAANAVGVVPFEGTVVPVFKTLTGFDNLGNTLGNAFALGSGGSGVVAAVQGTLSSGYRRINRDCDTSRVCRIDFLVNWDPTDTTGSIQVGLGNSTNRNQIVLNNTASGTLQATFFNVAGTTTAVSGAVGSSVIQLSVGVVIGNGGVTTSVCPTGAQHAFTAPNSWLSCQYFWQHITSVRLNNLYFGSTSATSTIVGFMANTNGLDGDPQGRILTRTVAQNLGGTPNCAASCSTAAIMDHDNVFYLSERSNPSVPVKTVILFHGRTSNGGPDNCGGPNQNAAPNNTYSVCYALLAAGYNVISDQGGTGTTTPLSDWWGAPHGVEYAKQTLDVYQKNVYNTGKTYAIGQSMGGVDSLNFIRTYPNIVSAAYEATPAIDLNETSCPLGIACAGSTLKTTMDTAYRLIYVSVLPTANTGNNPATDNGTNWIVAAEAGANPNVGYRSWNLATITAAVTNSQIVTLSAATNVNPGDYLYFTNSQQVRRAAYRAGPAGTAIGLDDNITTAANEVVRIIHSLPNGKPDPTSFDFSWLNTINGGTAAYNPATAYALGNPVFLNSSTPDLDEAAWNPTRIPEAFGNVVVEIAIGGDGTCGSNDGILNNQQMCDFVNNMNAVYPGKASFIGTPGGHVTPAMQPSIILPFFAAN